MSGIIFLKTQELQGMSEFYGRRLEMKLWLDQGACKIFARGNMLLGFCQADTSDLNGCITFFFESRAEVDAHYQDLRDIAAGAPRFNKDFNIYQFFARDPEGRMLEFQQFCHPLQPFSTLEQGLMYRRSIRKYTSEPVSEELLTRVFDLCRYSPTARNMQAYYYIVIRDRDILHKIVSIRGIAGAPILAAPLAVAVCARGDLARRVVQDACIAAYHLLLAAKAHSLGTCWVTDMDKPEIKKLLGVPEDDYVACLTPLGWPDETHPLPERHDPDSFVRYL